MVKECYKCKKLNFLNPNLSFHLFPKDPDKKKLWIKNLKMENKTVPKMGFICSDHFDNNDFIYNCRGTCVLKNSDVLPKPEGIEIIKVKDEPREKPNDCFQQLLSNSVPKFVMERLQYQHVEDIRPLEEYIIKSEMPDIKEESLLDPILSDIVYIKIESNEAIDQLEKRNGNIFSNCVVSNEGIIIKEEEVESSNFSLVPEERQKENEEDNQLDLRPQLRKKNKHEIYKCWKCNFETPLKSHLKRHVIRHRCYNCHICDFKTRSENRLKKHYCQHSAKLSVKLYQCNECIYWTRFKYNFKRHCLRHKDPKFGISRCRVCHFKTNTKCDLMKHYFHEHSGVVNVYQCSDCDHQVVDKANFERHCSRHKASEKLSSCHICDFKTWKKSDLMEHFLDQHSEEVNM